MIQKIKYRLVYNRQKRLNKQGTALVQIEAYLNQRKVYFKTNVYLKPECWSKEGAQVVNHPQSNDLNAMLYENILQLQALEISYWKRGIESTLSQMKEDVAKGVKPAVSFLKFCEQAIERSDRTAGTKSNLRAMCAVLKEFRKVVEFNDLTYTFVKDFETFLNGRGLKVNTVAKHLRNLRTMVNEAINDGYIHPEAYPFRKFKVKKEKTEHKHLMPDELRRLEKMQLPDKKNNHRKVLDAFLFCCYTGLRFSDFKGMKEQHIVSKDGQPWLVMNSQKTGVKIKIPLHLLFRGKALKILGKYTCLEELTSLGCNADTNRTLRDIIKKANITHRITFHSSRHTCATLLVHQGVPITTVQAVLGHTSVRTTQIYAEVMSETMIKDLTKANRKQEKKVNVFRMDSSPSTINISN